MYEITQVVISSKMNRLSPSISVRHAELIN